MIGYKYTDNEIKIAEWLGYKWQQSRHISEDGHWRKDGKCTPTSGIPHFETSDADAVTLLPLLAQKGFWWELHLTNANSKVQVNIHKYDASSLGRCVAIAAQPTISQAISAAMVQVIDSI